MRAVGIDLGTTNSVAATGGKDLRVLPTRSGESLTPSVISFAKKKRSEEGEIIVGRQAVSNAVKAPEDTIFSIKRLMGALYGEDRVEEVCKRVSYRILDPTAEGSDKDAQNTEDAAQGVQVLLGGRPYSPIDLSAMILRHIKEDAELALGEPVTHAVITVPAYFEERQRAATKSAGEQAGLKVLKIIDEPTAAAIAFGVSREEEQHRVLVFDLGGGTFDISIIQMVGGQYQVMEIQGDNWLGGDDFDATIVERLIALVKEEYDGYDPSEDKNFLAKAKEEAQKIKHALSSQQEVEVYLPLAIRVPGQGMVDIDTQISRQEFEADIRPKVERTIELVHAALDQQNLTPEDITQVLLVGGSTAVPLVHQSVTDVFGEGKVKRHINPMECVALGAAILAASLSLQEDPLAGDPSSEEDTISLVEVTPMHLGIAAVKGKNPDAFVPIIPKGTAYPLDEPRKHLFYPTEDNQTLIRVAVYEGMNALASLNEQQGVIEFPLPNGIRSTEPVEVAFNYDKNRVLTVSIRVLSTEYHLEETLRRDRGRVVKNREEKSLLDDWREELQPAIRMGRHFEENYGKYMGKTDARELTEAIEQAEKALEMGDPVRGRQAYSLLNSKIFESGVASQLFIAERVMHDAPTEVARQISEVLWKLRTALDRHEQEGVDQMCDLLRVVVARLISEQARVRGVEDRVDLSGLLKVRNKEPDGQKETCMEHALMVGIDCSDDNMSVVYIADAKSYNLAIPNDLQMATIAFDNGASISSLGVRFPNLRSVLGTRIPVAHGSRIETPEYIVEKSFATIFQSLARMEDKPIEEVVLAVPSSLGQNGRRALLDCCRNAKFHHVSLIDRCSAAAIGYYGERDKAMTYLVYDLGYGDFEYALVRLAKGRCRVLSSGILSQISGEYLDAVIMEAVVLALREQNLFMGLKKWSSQQWLQFRELAADARLALRQNPHIDITLAPTLTKLKEAIRVRLHASSFNASIAPLIDRTIEMIQGALESNALELADVDAFLIVGDVAQKPPILDKLTEAFPGSLQCLDRDVVANGSALYASLLAKSGADWTGQVDTDKALESEDSKANSSSDALKTEAEAHPNSDPRAKIAEVIATPKESMGQSPAGPLSQNPLAKEESLQTARRLIQEGHSEKAIALLEQILHEADALLTQVRRQTATPARAVIRQAQARLETQQYSDAIVLSHSAYEMDKNDPEVFTAMIQIHLQAGRQLDHPAEYEHAINFLKCAGMHDPTDRSVRSAIAERHYKHALVMKSQNKVPECLELLKQTLDYTPKHKGALELQQELTETRSAETKPTNARGMASST